MPRKRCPPLPSRHSFKRRHTAQLVESRFNLAAICLLSGGTSVQCTTCTAAVATLMLCRYLGGEDPDFTIEMAQQTPGTLGEDSHVKAHIGKFHNLGNKGLMLELLGRSKAKVTFARSETRKASNTSRATLDVKRLWRHFHKSKTESYHMPARFHS